MYTAKRERIRIGPIALSCFIRYDTNTDTQNGNLRLSIWIGNPMNMQYRVTSVSLYWVDIVFHWRYQTCIIELPTWRKKYQVLLIIINYT